MVSGVRNCWLMSAQNPVLAWSSPAQLSPSAVFAVPALRRGQHRLGLRGHQE